MDEYQKEIKDLQQKIYDLERVGGPNDMSIEFTAQLRNLQALYRATEHFCALGAADVNIKRLLSDLGYGEWSFASAYNAVYDAVIDAEWEGESIAQLTKHLDIAQSLREQLKEQEG